MWPRRSQTNSFQLSSFQFSGRKKNLEAENSKLKTGNYFPMKFAIVGAGAIGALIGAMLSKAGEDVTLIARGPHLRAMQENGVRVHGSIGEFSARPNATDDPASIGTVDYVLLTVKAHSLTDIAPR